MHRNDPFYIFDHFDTYFTVIESNINENSTLTHLMRTFNLLYLTTEKLGSKLAQFLAAGEPQERKRYLNLTKMTMFLFVNTVKKIDIMAQRAQQHQQQNVKKRGGEAADCNSYSFIIYSYLIL